MSLLSLSHCKTSFNVTPVCIISPPFQANLTQYNVVGGLNKGEFEGGPDIAGIGVLLALLGVAAVAVLAGCWYLSINIFLRILLPRIAFDQNAKTRLTSLLQSLSSSSKDMILSCADQQIVTGLALSIFLGLSSSACTLSTYHYIIIVNSMLVCCVTFSISAVTVRKFWEGRLAATLRLAAGVALFGVTGAAVNLTNQYAFPTSTSNDLLVLPVVCIGSLWSQRAVAPADLTPQVIIIILLSTVAIFAVTVQCVRFIKTWQFNRSFKDHWDRFERWVQEGTFKDSPHISSMAQTVETTAYFVLFFGLGAGLVIYLFVQFFLLRSWLNGSGWLDTTEEGSENDIRAIGLMLPAVLFVLPLLQVAGIFKPAAILGWKCIFDRTYLFQPSGPGSPVCTTACEQHCPSDGTDIQVIPSAKVAPLPQ